MAVPLGGSRSVLLRLSGLALCQKPRRMEGGVLPRRRRRMVSFSWTNVAPLSSPTAKGGRGLSPPSPFLVAVLQTEL